MKSRFKLPLAIALALGSAPALALQLGEIRVKSALDEPLVAEIPIQLDNLTEAKDLRVGLASPADFAKAGLSRNGLDHLRFNIVSDSTGHKLVLVTSDQPVGDPYLDFLIEVDSSRGKQLREYTVLLDPVITAPPPEQAMASGAMAPQPAAPAPAPAPAPAAQPAAPPPPAAAPPPAPKSAPVQSAPPPASAPAAARANEYTVQRGDTLYRIASETRPDDNVSVDQMMLALQSNNPDAFYKPNINNLKSGAILRIPTRDEIASAPSGTRARAQVHRQIEDWRGTSARQATTVAGNEAPVEQAAPAKTSAEGDKLALVPPTQSGGSASTRAGEKGGTGTAEVAGLKQQLATARESLTSAQQENSELQSRVKDLEDISNKNQKLLGMKDAQIAELQSKLAQMQKGGAAATPSSAAPAPAASTASVPAAAASKGTATTGSNVAVSAASAAPPPAAGSTPTPATTVAPVVRPNKTAIAKPLPTATTQKAPPAAQEETPWYQRPVTWIVAAIVIVALILLGLLRRRPRQLPDPLAEPDAPSLADHFGQSPLPPQPHIDEEVADDASHEADVSPVQTEVEPVVDEVPPAPVIAEAPPDAEAEQHYDFEFDEPPSGEPVAEPGMPAAQPPVAGSDDITREHNVEFDDVEPEPAPSAEAVRVADDEVTREHATPEFSDDPVDTKLDLARAYLDMGDPAGARAMLEEVLNEGSQAQKDEAKRLLESGA
ncbi:MAG TPA: FimV/HubP family polar landmark protein [Rhodanobacteraceae bacterium]|nr:FimV/HubP family polar landmark protein [Rhodanobacteraceae bacterium]